MNFFKLLEKKLKKLKKLIYRIIKPNEYKQGKIFQQKRKEYSELSSKGEIINYKLSPDCTFSLYPKGQIANLLYTQDFENEILLLVKDYLKKGMHVIDVGANIGIYSILADKLVKPSGKIWSFEPSSQVNSLLQDNLKLNHVNTVNVAQIALGDQEDQTMKLVLEEGFGDGYRYIVNDKEELSQKKFSDIKNVKVTTLDSFLDKKGEKKVDFIKVDVEGEEFNVLKGAEHTISNNTQIVILFENSSIGLARSGHTQQKLYKYLNKFGLKLFSWNNQTKEWETDQGAILANGNIWATREKKYLPRT